MLFCSKDSLYNPTAKKGVIFHKFRNAKAVAARKIKTFASENEMMSEAELKSQLKYCVVKNDKAHFKELMRQTVGMRRKLLKADDPDLKDFWTVYFVDTDLVRYNCVCV